MRRAFRVILLFAWLMACMYLAFVVFRLVRGLGLADDPRLNEGLGWVGWFFAFLLLVFVPPALKVLFTQGPRALRSILSGPVKRAFLLAIAFSLAAGLVIGYAGFERGEWVTTLVGAPLAVLVCFVWLFCFIFVLASFPLLYGIGSGGGYYGGGGDGGGDGGVANGSLRLLVWEDREPIVEGGAGRAVAYRERSDGS